MGYLQLRDVAVYAALSGKGQAYVDEWQEARRVRRAHQTKDYLHRKRSTSDGSVTQEAWNAMVEFVDNRCLACGAEGVTMDHVIPLSRNGTHTIQNLQPLCQPCNSSKCDDDTDYRPQFMWHWHV